MTNLISGKEALIALANGEEVEYKLDKSWFDAVYLSAFDFLSGNYKLRIKPRTINLNDVECQGEAEAFKLVKEFFDE